MILVQQFESQLPAIFQERKRCEYGVDCNKKDVLAHSKNYKHWFLSNLKEKLAQKPVEECYSEDEESDQDSSDISEDDDSD